MLRIYWGISIWYLGTYLWVGELIFFSWGWPLFVLGVYFTNVMNPPYTVSIPRFWRNLEVTHRYVLRFTVAIDVLDEDMNRWYRPAMRAQSDHLWRSHVIVKRGSLWNGCIMSSCLLIHYNPLYKYYVLISCLLIPYISYVVYTTIMYIYIHMYSVCICVICVNMCIHIWYIYTHTYIVVSMFVVCHFYIMFTASTNCPVIDFRHKDFFLSSAG